jgi:DNA-binding transcriptional regulator YhcF (GntR family)
LNNNKDKEFLRPLKISSQPLYLQTREYIYDNILSRNWKPGEKLPPDQMLAKKLGINHITLGKALNLLRDEGYLVRTRGRGTFVCENLPEKNSELEPKIAIVFDDANESIFNNKLFLAIHNALEKYNMRMEFISSKGDSQVQLQQLLKLTKDKSISGCILWPLLDKEQFKKFLAARSPLFPVVVLDHNMNEIKIDFSGYDNHESGKLLGRQIARQGFKNSCFCYREKKYNYNTNQQRLAGLQDGTGFDIEIFNDFSSAQYNKLIDKINELSVKSSDRTAVVISSEMCTETVKNIMKQSGSLPKNIDLFTFQIARENLTGIKMPVAEIGKNAVEIINARLNGDTSKIIEKRETGKIIL